ncbi:MAG: P1 family peptidase, partial [Nitriliruptorales bacterium]
VAKVGGIEHGWRSGQGIAVRRAGGVTVGAIVANNAVGEVIADDGSWLARSRAPDDVVRYPESWRAFAGARDEHGRLVEPAAGPTEATVIGCIVTDAILTKTEAVRVADIAHGGTMRAVRPAHTSMDGDALFCLAAQRVESHVDLVAHLATEAVAEAARRGPLAATGREGLPGLADLPA